MDGYVIGNSASRRRFATRFVPAILLVLLASTTSIRDTVAWANGELRDALRNMTLPSEWTRSGQAPLVGGVYEELTAKDLASKIVIRLTDAVASGTIGGQTVTALVIVTEPGGSGVFFDLYLVQQRDNHWRIMNRVYLGDRIRVNTIKVEGDVIALDLTVHAVHDGICCPSERSSIYFALRARDW
jgi:hypothetical protein